MYSVDEIFLMSGMADRALAESLYLGLDEIGRQQKPLQEGIGGKLLTIGAILAGTIFSGCAGNQARNVPALDVDQAATVSNQTVSTLAMEIANGIHDEMETSDRVTDTQSWQAAKDIYRNLVDSKKQGLADMFARVVNRKTKEFFNAPPCCDNATYDNTRQEVPEQHSEYNPATGYWEVKN